MGGSCAVKGCYKGSDTTVRLFRFPRDPERRRRWINALRQPEFVLTVHKRLCNRHFVRGQPHPDSKHVDYVPKLFSYTSTLQRQQLIAAAQRYERSVGLKLQRNATAKTSRTVASRKHRGHNRKAAAVDECVTDDDEDVVSESDEPAASASKVYSTRSSSPASSQTSSSKPPQTAHQVISERPLPSRRRLSSVKKRNMMLIQRKRRQRSFETSGLDADEKCQFKCQYCSRGFSHEIKLRLHLSAAHTDRLGQYQCPKCWYRFTTRAVLAEHIRQTHDMQKTWLAGCPVCNKPFTDWQHIQSHKNADKHVKHQTVENCDMLFQNVETDESHSDSTVTDEGIQPESTQFDACIQDSQKSCVSLENESSVDAHANSVPLYQCCVCRNLFETADLFSAHDCTRNPMDNKPTAVKRASTAAVTVNAKQECTVVIDSRANRSSLLLTKGSNVAPSKPLRSILKSRVSAVEGKSQLPDKSNSMEQQQSFTSAKTAKFNSSVTNVSVSSPASGSCNTVSGAMKNSKISANSTGRTSKSSAGRQYICQHCDKVFQNRLVFNIHQKSQHPATVVKREPNCSQLKFMRANTIRYTLRSSKTRLMTISRCDICEIWYDDPLELDDHMLASHPENIAVDDEVDVALYQCPSCKAMFPRTNDYLGHECPPDEEDSSSPSTAVAPNIIVSLATVRADILSEHTQSSSTELYDVHCKTLPTGGDANSMTYGNSADDMRKCLHAFQKEGYLCDVVFVADDGVARVHSVVLAASSDVMKSLMFPLEKPAEQKIILPGMDYPMLLIVVHFMYTGKIAVTERYATRSGISKVMAVFKEFGFKVPINVTRSIEMGDWEALSIQKSKPSKSAVSSDSSSNRSVGGDQQLIAVTYPTVEQDASVALSKPRCAGKEPFDIKTLYSQLGPKEPKPPEQHLCDICGREFNNKHAMNMHHWWHKKPTNECDRCGKQFSQPKRLLMHIQVHHNEAGSSARPYRCQHCGKHFVAKGFLANHIAKKHKDVGGVLAGVTDDGTLRQDVTGSGDQEVGLPVALTVDSISTFNLLSDDLSLAMHIVAEDSRASAAAAAAAAGMQNRFPRHAIISQALDSSVVNSSLAYVGQETAAATTVDPIQLQVVQFVDQKMFTCQACSCSFMSREHLEQHKVTCVEHLYGCPVCGRRFRNEYQCVEHMNKAHDSSDGREYLCALCAKPFRSQHLLEIHERSHT